jgi:hypothetical protein
MRDEIPARDEMRDEIPVARPVDPLARVASLKGTLVDAARHNVDLSADVAPIRSLLDQGCDLEADILPIVAREVPELPRPLKNGAPHSVCEPIKPLLARRQDFPHERTPRGYIAVGSRTQP